MLTVKTQIHPDKVTVSLEGVANESIDLDGTLGPVFRDPAHAGKPFVVACANVTRINSTAIKHWIRFFEAARADGVSVLFLAVAPLLVEQFNRISNFGAHFPVLSAVLPFTCTACSKETYRVFTREEALAADLDTVAWPCPHCKAQKMEFDDLPDDYLRFWKKDA